MNVSFSDISVPKSGTLTILLAAPVELTAKVAEIDEQCGGAISRAIETTEFTAKKGSFLELVAPPGLSVSRILLAGVGPVEELNVLDFENFGGEIMAKLLPIKEKNAAVLIDGIKPSKTPLTEVASRVAMGLRLRNYKFDTYKTQNKDNGKETKLDKVTIMSGSSGAARRAFSTLDKIAEGVDLARDLVNEPANILYPAEFAKRLKALSKLDVKVEVLGETQMKKLGMGSLLGVGQGSEHESQLVVMTYNGGEEGVPPLAFVGKGVCFDTGGISLKPAASMEDMKGDMGGAACVSGLMHALAARKAKVNVVGIVALVENMPDGKAQRPGDIVTSMSGQTIEVINTDAEGRLILADALWYCQDRFKPKFMVDLATLTGAIIIALGKEYAGLFSNDDKLAERLTALGSTVGEKVWRLPMGPAYDKLIESKFADMKNVGGRDAGSIAAAQFLQRFVNKTPWVHLDVAGTAMASPGSPTNISWGSGWGVRLLNQLVADHYEK